MVVAIRRRIEVGSELNYYSKIYNYDEVYHKTRPVKCDYSGPWEFKYVT